MHLLDPCVRWKRRASADLEHFWLRGSELPESDKYPSPTVSIRSARSLHPRCPQPTGQSRFATIRKVEKFFRRPPAYVWIRNHGSEDIIVVVSRLGPLRTLGGAELSGSATGGGIKFDLDSFSVGATRKILQPESVVGQAAATALFPLWSHSSKAGVVSVYNADDRSVLIGNDQVAAGSLAIYRGGPDLDVYNYWGEHIDSGPPVVDLSQVVSYKDTGGACQDSARDLVSRDNDDVGGSGGLQAAKQECSSRISKLEERTGELLPGVGGEMTEAHPRKSLTA